VKEHLSTHMVSPVTTTSILETGKKKKEIRSKDKEFADSMKVMRGVQQMRQSRNTHQV